MAINRIRKFLRIDDLQFFLNGAIVGGVVNKSQGGGSPAPLGVGVNNLVGTTLVFTTPAVTVTFVTSDGVGGSAQPGVGTNPDKYTLLFKDIKLQIEAASAALLVVLDADQKLVIMEKVPAAGVVLNHTGTANAILGFDTSAVTTGKVYTPVEVNNAAPCWTWAYSGNDNMHNVYTWE